MLRLPNVILGHLGSYLSVTDRSRLVISKSLNQQSVMILTGNADKKMLPAYRQSVTCQMFNCRFLKDHGKALCYGCWYYTQSCTKCAIKTLVLKRYPCRVRVTEQHPRPKFYHIESYLLCVECDKTVVIGNTQWLIDVHNARQINKKVERWHPLLTELMVNTLTIELPGLTATRRGTVGYHCRWIDNCLHMCINGVTTLSDVKLSLIHKCITICKKFVLKIG